MPHELVKREFLYDEVWREPVATVAKRYGISDVALSKACRKADVPLPPRGYWAKLAAGRAPPKTPIRHDRFQADAPVHIRTPAAHELTARERAAPAVETAVTALSQARIDVGPHPLAAKAKKTLSRKTGWTDYKGLRSAPKDVLNISVTEGAVDRACTLLSNLLHAFEAVGGEITVVADKSATVLRLNGAAAEMEVTEHVGRSNHVNTPSEERALKAWQNSYGRGTWPSIPQYDYTPSGRLTIKVGRWPSRSWSDTPRRKLEERIEEIVSETVLLMAQIFAKEEAEAQRVLNARKAKERYESLVQAKEDERLRLGQLKRAAVARVRAAQIRDYVEAVSSNAEAHGDLTPELAEWIAWALAKADLIDPMIEISDPVLDAPLPKKPLWGW